MYTSNIILITLKYNKNFDKVFNILYKWKQAFQNKKQIKYQILIKLFRQEI
jgi:hypothetical protein